MDLTKFLVVNPSWEGLEHDSEGNEWSHEILRVFLQRKRWKPSIPFLKEKPLHRIENHGSQDIGTIVREKEWEHGYLVFEDSM